MMHNPISRLIIPFGALSAFIAVAAGAFAAHGLKNSMSVEYINTFKTAVEYQMTHSLGLIIIGILNRQNGSELFARKNNLAASFMLLGIILFSGSLYLLTLTDTTWLGMITPFGGICFLLAWLILALNYLKQNIVNQ